MVWKRKVCLYPYVVIWNVHYAGRGKTAIHFASFKTRRARHRFCKALVKNPSFVSLDMIIDL